MEGVTVHKMLGLQSMFPSVRQEVQRAFICAVGQELSRRGFGATLFQVIWRPTTSRVWVSNEFRVQLPPFCSFMISFDDEDSLEQMKCITILDAEVETSMPDLSYAFEPTHGCDSYSFEAIDNMRSKVSMTQIIPLDIRAPGSVEDAIFAFEKCIRFYKAIKPYVLEVEPPERDF